MSTVIERPSFSELTARQQQVWSSGDYSVVASMIHSVAERLSDDADLRAGWQVLDVATGSGNAAIAAARLGCRVTGIDYVPELLARGRERAAAERLDVELIEGDAQSLPFADAAFNAATSVFGVMFAADQGRAARELLRVVRPGGTIALAAWTPIGFVGEMFRLASSYAPPAPGTPSPLLWGTEEGVRMLLADGLSYLQLRERRFVFRATSAERLAQVFARTYGPLVRAVAAAGAVAGAELRADLAELMERRNRLPEGGPLAISASYLEAIGTRR